jgi:replicative DNA helicase
MSESELFDRFVASDSGIPGQIVRKIRMNDCDAETMRKHSRAFGESSRNIAARGHIIKSDGIISINEFRALVAMYANDIDCAIIDYIQQLRPTSGKQSKMEKVEEASWACKDLASTYKIPVIALSQLNREGYKDGNKPSLATLRESGQIEQDANNVWMMWRPKAEGVAEEEMELFLAKNRNGPICRINLDFDLVGKIKNLSPFKPKY